jgi:hypothetical protein
MVKGVQTRTNNAVSLLTLAHLVIRPSPMGYYTGYYTYGLPPSLLTILLLYLIFTGAFKI